MIAARFTKMDTNRDGFISLDEAKAVYQSEGVVFGDKEQADYESCDTNGNGKVDFQEFLAKCLSDGQRNQV